MAIADGSLLLPQTIVSALLLDGAPLLAQPPHIGIASGADGPPVTNVDVLWDNGEFSQNVPIGSLVEILPADAATIAQLAGKVVRRTVNDQSEEYIGVPVLLAKAALSQSVDFAVVKSVGPGNFYWVSVTSELEVVAR